MKNKILVHITFWVIILLISFSSESWKYEGTISWVMFLHFIVAFIMMALTSYFNALILIPKLFKKKKYLAYCLSVIAALVLGSVIILLIRKVLLNIGLEIPSEWEIGAHDNWNYFLHILVGNSLLLLLTSLFYTLEELIELQNVSIKLKESEREKVQAQLQGLKAQINPHFLFNTLNNIYSHSLTQSAKTPEMILKLSDLMSYILYECDDEKVYISDELDFVKNYVDLEKLRYEDQINLNFSVENLCADVKIAPLLFIPFIENAFKHGGSIGHKKRYVNITISIDAERISLIVKNSIDNNSNNLKNLGGGIGIGNVEKRLSLLYKDSYILELNRTCEEYSVKLEIFNYGD